MSRSEQINELVAGLTTFSFPKNPIYLTDEEKLVEKIYKILTPNWIRFSSINPEMKEFILEQISKMVKAKQPVKILNACGGFKNPRIDTAPHIDYAEVFHLSFFINSLVLKISEIYEPGVHLEYSGDAHIVSYVDNVPKADVDTYLKEFNALLDDLAKELPKNTKLTHKHFLDFYDYNKFTSELDSVMEKEDLNSKENKELIKKYYERAKSNFVVKGAKDYSALPEKELRKEIERSVIKAYRWYDLDFKKRGDYFESTVPVCNLANFPDTYCLRSVRFQPAPPFWQGKGVFINRDEVLIPAILHVNKYLEENKKMETIEVNNPVLGLATLKNIQILVQQSK